MSYSSINSIFETIFRIANAQQAILKWVELKVGNTKIKLALFRLTIFFINDVFFLCPFCASSLKERIAGASSHRRRYPFICQYHFFLLFAFVLTSQGSDREKWAEKQTSHRNRTNDYVRLYIRSPLSRIEQT